MTDATWDGFLDGNWNNPGTPNGTNWNGNGGLAPSGTATFPGPGAAFNAAITFSAQTTIQNIQFSGGQLYTFTLAKILSITGNGLSNAQGQIFTVNSFGGLIFQNTALADRATINVAGGFVDFRNNSSLVNATLNINNQITVTFHDSSSAGTPGATITNTNGLAAFTDQSTAGGATIMNNSGGSTEFFFGASAGSAHITNSGGGYTVFHDEGTAASALITNNGGHTDFQIGSTGSTATIIQNSSGFVDLSQHDPGSFFIGSITGGQIQLGSHGVQVHMTGHPLTGQSSAGGELAFVGNAGGAVTTATLTANIGLISGNGGITMDALGTLTLSAVNTYTGNTVITAGTVELAQGGSIAGNFVFQSSAATLKLDATNQIGGTIDGFVKGDNIDLAFHTFATGDHFVWAQNATNTAGTLSLVNGAGGVITTLNLSGVHNSSEFGVASDGSGGTVFTDTVVISTTTIQNDYLAIIRSVLPLDQATTVANSINAGTQTETQYINGLLTQVANTTLPAVAVEASMYGATGTSAEITALTLNFLPSQVANATANHLNPLVYAAEVLGFVFAFANENGGTAFASNFGPSNSAMPNTTAGDAAFATAASTTIFGSASTANLVNVMQGFIGNWKGFFTANGVIGISNPTAAQIDLAARATAWGDMVGVALANNLGPLNGQAINFLQDAAQGTAVYGQSLASQANHNAFQGAAAAGAASGDAVSVTGISNEVDGTHLI